MARYTRITNCGTARSGYAYLGEDHFIDHGPGTERVQLYPGQIAWLPPGVEEGEPDYSGLNSSTGAGEVVLRAEIADDLAERLIEEHGTEPWKRKAPDHFPELRLSEPQLRHYGAEFPVAAIPQCERCGGWMTIYMEGDALDALEVYWSCPACVGGGRALTRWDCELIGVAYHPVDIDDNRPPFAAYSLRREGTGYAPFGWGNHRPVPAFDPRTQQCLTCGEQVQHITEDPHDGSWTFLPGVSYYRGGVAHGLCACFDPATSEFSPFDVAEETGT